MVLHCITLHNIATHSSIPALPSSFLSFLVFPALSFPVLSAVLSFFPLSHFSSFFFSLSFFPFCIWLCCIVLYCVVLYYVVLCCVVLCCVVLCCVVLRCVVLSGVVLCSVMFHYVSYCLALYYIVLYRTVLHSLSFIVLNKRFQKYCTALTARRMIGNCYSELRFAASDTHMTFRCICQPITTTNEPQSLLVAIWTHTFCITIRFNETATIMLTFDLGTWFFNEKASVLLVIQGQVYKSLY